MQRQKRRIIAAFLIVELILFSYGYCCGSRGLIIVYAQHKKNKELELQVAYAQQECTTLEDELAAWKTNPLYKERYAREVLQMAKPDEKVYFLGV